MDSLLQNRTSKSSFTSYETLPRKPIRPHIGSINQFTMIEGTNYSYRAGATDDFVSARGPPLPPKTRKNIDRSKSLDLRSKEPWKHARGTNASASDDFHREQLRHSSTLCNREPLQQIQVGPDIISCNFKEATKGITDLLNDILIAI